MCWAHLERNFRAMAERGGESGVMGQELLGSVQGLFHGWARYREGQVKHSTLRSYLNDFSRTRRGLMAREKRGASGGARF